MCFLPFTIHTKNQVDRSLLSWSPCVQITTWSKLKLLWIKKDIRSDMNLVEDGRRPDCMTVDFTLKESVSIPVDR